MSRFQNDQREKRKKQLKARGYHKVGEQHNGCLYVHLSEDNTLYRRVVTMIGKVLKYKPRTATDREIQMYGLT